MNEATKNSGMTVATGQLNTTVVTVAAIGAIALFFNVFVWPSIKTNIVNSTKCSTTTNCVCTGKNCKCMYLSGNNKMQEITCPNNNIKK